MSRVISCAILALGATLLAGCTIGTLTGEPRLPEPRTPSWERPDGSSTVHHSTDRAPGRVFQDEENRRAGMTPRNPDYGYMRPGAQASAGAWSPRDLAEPIVASEWATPVPAGSWEESGSTAPSTAASVEVSTASTEVYVAPAPAPSAAQSSYAASAPMPHSTVGSSSGRSMAPPAPRPAPAPMQPAATAAPRPMPAPAPMPQAPPRGAGYQPPPPPRN